MLDRMKVLHEEMYSLTIRSGIKVEDYNLIASEINETTPLDRQRTILEFLEQTHDKEYQSALEIWNLLKEEIWDRYKTFGITGLREQILLEEKLTKLRKCWRTFINKWKAMKPK